MRFTQPTPDTHRSSVSTHSAPTKPEQIQANQPKKMLYRSDQQAKLQDLQAEVESLWQQVQTLNSQLLTPSDARHGKPKQR